MSKQKKVEEGELENYAKHFDDNIAHTLLKTLRKSTRDKPKIISGATGAIVTVLGKLLSAWENPATPAPIKALAIGAIGYIILPVDLIPDVLPVVGYKYCNFTLADLDKEIDAEEGLALCDTYPSDDELDAAFEAGMEDDE